MNQAALLLLSLCFFLSVTSAAPSPAPNNSSSTCPMDLNYVLRIPWNTSFCHQYETNKASCCQNLLALFGISLAQHLKETSLFQLPDLPTSISCLQDFQSKLTALSFPSNLVSSCFNPLQFVISRNICAQIESTQDWVVKLGSNTPLDSGCRSDLTDLTSCDGCNSAGLQVLQELISIDGNSSKAVDCFYFAILYAAGIVNKLGPESDGVVSCIFALPLDSQVGSAGKNRSARFGSCFWVNSSWGCGFGHVLFVGILLLV